MFLNNLDDPQAAEIRLLRALMKQTAELAQFMEDAGRLEDVQKLRAINRARRQETNRITQGQASVASD